jgi:hypothetical protein
VKIGDVSKLLEGIGHGLGDLSKSTSSGLIAFHQAMQPFAEQTIEQFAGFLIQCEEYQRMGIVAAKGKATRATTKKSALTVEDAAASVRALLAEIDHGTVTGARIDAVLADIKKGFTKAKWEELLTNLQIGKAKTIDQAVEKVKQVLNSQLEMHVKAQGFGGST